MKNRCAVLVVLPVREAEPETHHKDTKAQRGFGHRPALAALCSWRPGGSISGLVMISLFAFGLANADFDGVIDPKTTITRIDSVILTLQGYPDMTFLTPGWGTHTPYDVFSFTGVPRGPETITLHGTVNGFDTHKRIAQPQADTWYPISMAIVTSMVSFHSGGIEESRLLAERPQRLYVSPSVVTGQMTVKLQPVGTGGQVVEIHDAVGDVVRALGCTAGNDGTATAIWNREDEHGRLVPEGVYFCRYAAGDAVAVRKVMVTH